MRLRLETRDRARAITPPRSLCGAVGLGVRFVIAGEAGGLAADRVGNGRGLRLPAFQRRIEDARCQIAQWTIHDSIRRPCLLALGRVDQHARAPVAVDWAIGARRVDPHLRAFWPRTPEVALQVMDVVYCGAIAADAGQFALCYRSSRPAAHAHRRHRTKQSTDLPEWMTSR